MQTQDLIGLIITLLVTAASLFIIAQLSAFTGVEIDNFKKALWSAVVFGLLNAFVRPVFAFFTFPLTFITLGLFTVIINAVIFGLAAWLVQGFRLRWGIWSALIGSLALGVINSLIFKILFQMGLVSGVS